MIEDYISCDISEILKLDSVEFMKPEVYSGIGSRVLEIENHGEYGEAGRLLNFLHFFLQSRPEFRQQAPDAHDFYEGLVVWLQFINLPFLMDSELYEVMKTNLVTGIQLGADIRGAIRTLFSYSWDPFLRGEKRDMLLRAFSENHEQIGMIRLRDGRSGAVSPAIVRQVIIDYNRFARVGDERGSLEQVRYIDQSPSLVIVTPENRELLLKVLQVYDFVRFPPLMDMLRTMAITPLAVTAAQRVGTEKRNLPSKPLEFSKRTPAMPARPNLDPLEVLKQKYEAYRIRRASVLKLEDELLIQTTGNTEHLKKELSSAARSNDKNRVIACLKVLARGQQLVPAFSGSPSWLEAVSQFIERRYHNAADPSDLRMVSMGIRSNPSSPAVISEFLQYLLKERLRMSENDSALIGVEICQLLGGDYQRLAFGDPETGSFVWAKNTIKNKSLVSETA